MPKREEIKENIRSRILETAFSEFAVNGYTKTKISDIAYKAEVSTGVINKYFESKENLFWELIRLMGICTLFDSIADRPIDDIFEIILEAVKKAIMSDKIHAEFDRMLVSSKDLPFEPKDKLEILEPAQPILRKVEELQKKGYLPDKETAAGLVFGLYKGAVILCRWYKELGLKLPENENMLFIIGYDRKAVKEGRQSELAVKI